jgi:drug/metabolite transporter (DMT)-like permease
LGFCCSESQVDFENELKNKISQRAAVPPKLVMVISVCAASTAAIFIRFAQQEIPSLLIAAYRLGIGSAVLAPITLIWYRKELLSLNRKQLLLMLFSGIFLALHFGAWISSLELTSVSSSVVFVSMSPLCVALLSSVFLREKITTTIWVGLILAIIGSVLIGFGDFLFPRGALIDFKDQLRDESFLGDLLAFLGAWFVAGYLLIGRKLRESLSIAPYAFPVFGIASVTLFVASAVAGYSITGYSSAGFIWVLYLGLVPQLLGHAAFNWTLKYLSATFVSIALLGEPVGSAILAFFILREKPSAFEIGGGVLILLGIFIASVRKK